MRAGQLRFLVTVEQPIEVRNSVGESETTWTFYEQTWAAIDPVRGNERLTMMQVKPTVDTKITMRARAAALLNPKMRIKYGDRTFDIDSIIDLNSRGIMKEIYCKEVA